MTYFSNSNMISCFFSSSFLISSSNPSVMLLSYCSSNLASSSLTYSTIFALSSISLLVLSIIFLKSITFYFTEFAKPKDECIRLSIFTHFFNLHELMPIVVIVDALDADLDGAGLAKVLNHLVWMSWTWYALKVSKQQWHRLFTIYEIKYFLIFPTLIS